MTFAMAIAAIVCLLACAALLAAEWRQSLLGRASFKLLASSAFVVVALQSGALASAYGRWILAALALSWIGDALLLSRQSRRFLLGLASFLLAHVAFALAFAQRPSDPALLAAALAAMGAFGGGVLAWLWRHLSTPFYRITVAAYVLAIVAMGALAIAASAAAGTWLPAAGAVAFAASDLAVARDRFVAPGFFNRAWGLPLYYAAQLLLAASVAAAVA